MTEDSSQDEDLARERRLRTKAETRAGEVAALLTLRGQKLVLAESCTGGLVAALLTDIPGASRFFWGGLVVYSEDAKRRLGGVDPAILASEGAVSRATALEMAEGALARSEADLAVSITGFAGPETAETETGPGRVVLAWVGRHDEPRVEEIRFAGGRKTVRLAAALRALDGIMDPRIGGSARY